MAGTCIHVVSQAGKMTSSHHGNCFVGFERMKRSQHLNRRSPAGTGKIPPMPPARSFLQLLFQTGANSRLSASTGFATLLNCGNHFKSR
jgi:hypothetical protein